MSARQDSHLSAAMSELELNGAIVLRIERNHVHPRVVFLWNGRERFYVTSGTPSTGGVAIIRQEVRRVLGVKPVRTSPKAVKRLRLIKERGPPRQRSRVATAVAPTITSQPSGFEALRLHPHHDLAADYGTAWQMFWSKTKRRMGFYGPWWEKV